MNLIVSIIALLMVADAVFTLSNLKKVESFIQHIFPNMNVKLLAMVEGGVGLMVLLLKFSTDSLS